MEITKHDASDERRVLIGMIVDRSVLARISAVWTGENFNSRWSNIIGKWCVGFFNKYDKAPAKAIENLFHAWADKGNNDKSTVQLVERFLQSLDGEYKQLGKESNADFVIDLASRHFNRVRLLRLASTIQGKVDDGDLLEAIEKVGTFSQVQLGDADGIDVLTDRAVIQEAFKKKRKPLITYPDALGPFFGDAFERDGFVAFEGIEKRGKSFWLVDVAWRAIMQGRKVAFFEAGDMSRDQILRRLLVRASKRPLDRGVVKVPTFIEHDSNGLTVDHETFAYKKNLDWKRAWKSCQQILKERLKGSSNLRLSVHPNDTLTVDAIKSIIQNWERQRQWTPDVIVIDYADILAPPPGFQETRDQINSTWKRLRALSQANHCLVVTATQADAKAYDAQTLTRANFTDDKRKMAHVTGMVGLNATDEETEKGVMRLNWVVRREAKFVATQCVYVAGCLDLANPAMKSCF